MGYEGGKGDFFPDLNREFSVDKSSAFPNPMRDIAKAMLHIHEHAEEWLVDTNKIVVCGFSAGAHNCAM